jgi:polyferredoxin
MRRDLDVSVLPERNPLYVTLKDGSVRNGYTPKITNRLAREETYRISVAGPPEARLSVAGAEREEAAGAEGLRLSVAPDSVGTFRAYVRVPRDALRGEAPLSVTLEASHGGRAVYRTNFQAPGGERR